MITIKTEAEIAILREGGRRLARILDRLVDMAKPGVAAGDLDAHALKLVREGGDAPSFLDYVSRGSKQKYPSTLCVSINNEVVHALPSKDKIIKVGDIVSIDLGLVHQGLYTDSAVTIGVGEIDGAGEKLIEVTHEALMEGIKVAVAGKHVGDIGHAIETFVKPYGFGIVRELAGHGVGYKVHEEPFIPNYGKAGSGAKLKPGMVIAIEPMVNEGAGAISVGTDGFAVVTADGKRSAHFEHTILVTTREPEILTART